MPKPEVILTIGMTSRERAAALQKMKDWYGTPEVSRIKYAVLSMVIENAKKQSITAQDIGICNDIFLQADLPDVHFMQHVINTTKGNNDFQDITAKATDLYHTLSVPLVYQTRGAAGVLGLFSIVAQTKIGLLSAGLMLAFGDKLVEWRIDKSLENKLALKKIGGTPPKVEDGFDSVNQGVLSFAKGTYHYTTEFFKNNIMPVISKQLSPPEVKEVKPR